MRAILFALFVGVMFTPGFAQAQEMLDVQADNLSIDNKTSQAVFTGNVVVTRDGVELQAEKVVVDYAKREDGTSNNEDVEQVEATGNVKIIDGTRVITAKKAVYDLPNDRMTLLDDVVVTEKRENTIRGTKMLYDITQGLITVSSDSGRVKAKLVPTK